MQNDPFKEGIAIIQVFINENYQKNTHFCYTAMKGSRMLNFTAYPNTLQTAYEVSCGCKKMKIEGMGSIVMKERFQADRRDNGHFTCTICCDVNERRNNFFEMTIKATNTDFNQKSGKIDAECSSLQIKEELGQIS
jgi:hypothetical protein